MKSIFFAVLASAVSATPELTTPDRDNELILRAVLAHYASEVRDQKSVCVEPGVVAEPLRALATGWSRLKPGEHYGLSTRPAGERISKDIGDALNNLPATAIRNRNFRVQKEWLRKPLRLAPEYDCAVGLSMQPPAIRGDLAVVHVHYHCGDGCGGTHLIGIRKEGPNWRAFAFSQQVIA